MGNDNHSQEGVQAPWARASGSTVVPTAVLRNSSLSSGAVRLYVLLCFYAAEGNDSPSLDVLARDLGVTDRTVRNYNQELVEAGLVEIRRQGRMETNVYKLLPLTPQRPLMSLNEARHLSMMGPEYVIEGGPEVVRELLDTLCDALWRLEAAE